MKKGQVVADCILDEKTLKELVTVWYALGIEAYWLITGVEQILDRTYSEEYWVSEIDREVAEWRRVLK